ncbi:MAG: hypothetical protein V4629_11275 [Pseudomonadota bacterium]
MVLRTSFPTLQKSYHSLFDILTACTTFILLTSCGGSGDSSTSNSVSAIQGQAIKGVLHSASVTAYAIDNGAIGEIIAESITADNGTFSLSINPVKYPLIVVRATANPAGSWMRCDRIDGCGTVFSDQKAIEHDINQNMLVDFGEWFGLESNFQLEALVDLSSSSEDFSITPLTHIASNIAKAMPVGLSADSAAFANHQVSTIIGLEGDITRIPSMDVTVTENVLPSNDIAQHALYSSALLNDWNPSTSLSDYLYTVSQEFAQSGGEILWRDDENISIEKLAADTAALARSLNFIPVETNALSLWQHAQQQPELSRVERTIVETSTDLASAKTFVKDVQQEWIFLHSDDSEYHSWVNFINSHLTHTDEHLFDEMITHLPWALVPLSQSWITQTLCATLTDSQTGELCSLLLQPELLSFLCELTQIGLNTAFPATFCQAGMALKITLPDGLELEYAALTRTLNLHKEDGENRLDLTMKGITNVNQTERVQVSGTIQNSEQTLVVDSSVLELTPVTVNGVDSRQFALKLDSVFTNNSLGFSFDSTQNINLTLPWLSLNFNFLTENFLDKLIGQADSLVDLIDNVDGHWTFTGALEHPELDLKQLVFNLKSINSSTNSDIEGIEFALDLSGLTTSPSVKLEGYLLPEWQINYGAIASSENQGPILFNFRDGLHPMISRQNIILSFINEEETNAVLPKNRGTLTIGDEIMGQIIQTDSGFFVKFGDGSQEQLPDLSTFL